jgi:hypothetical protein
MTEEKAKPEEEPLPSKGERLSELRRRAHQWGGWEEWLPEGDAADSDRKNSGDTPQS